MATFAITTSVNIDTLTGKTGGDVYNVNGGHLTIDQDSRYGVNQNTSASLGAVTLSATLGGNLTVDARYVRLIPYDNGTGVVPAAGTTIAGASGSGTLIGVWSALNVAPTAAAAAMPASGFIKIKGWNSSAYVNNEALTGIGADVNGTDVVGWIEIVGDDAATLTASRLNTVTMRGEWFKVGTTTGTNTDTYQIPSSGLDVYIGGAWVENDVSLSVSTASYSGEYVSITTTASHGLQTGDRVTITGVVPTGYNAAGVTVIVDDADTFHYYRGPNRSIAAYTSGGTVTDVLDFFPNANGINATAAAMATDGIRGRVCWIGTNGLIRFQHDGTNTTGGWLPPSGRSVYIGNILLTCCATGTRTANKIPHATVGTRYDFTTTGGAAIVMDKVMCNWYGSFTSAYSLDLTNVSFLTQMVTSKVIAPMTWTNVCISNCITTDAAPTGNHTVVGMQGGANYYNCHFSRSNWVSNGAILNYQDKIDFNFYYSKIVALVTRTTTNLSNQLLSRCFRATYTDCIMAIDQVNFSIGADYTLTNTLYYFEPVGTTLKTNSKFGFNASSTVDNLVLDGLWFGELPLVQPVGGILVAGAGCTNIYMRNIGTPTNRLSLGMPRRDEQAWTRVTTTATVTSVAHGLKVGDTLYVPSTSSVAAITVAAKTVVAVPTADTFTFACLNAGDASGTICYYPTGATYLFQIINSASLNGFYTNRVYVDHVISSTYAVDNSSINIELTDTIADLSHSPVLNGINLTTKNLGATNAIAAVSSVYGTHWFVSLVMDVTSSYSATWTRVTTTVTATATDHKLRPTTPGGIVVTASSDLSAIILGTKSVVAALTSGTFTFAGLNAGAASGTLTWQPVNARIGLMFNEATPQTTSTYSIVSGNPQFTSTGTLVMPTIGDEIIYESFEIRGHSAFTTLQGIMAGGTLNNYDIYYDIDRLDGNGYSGTWQNLDYKRAGTNISTASTTYTVTDATGINVGDYVSGTAVPPLAKVTNVDLGTNTITIDKTTTTNTTGAVSNYWNLPNETVPNTGFKMKWRFVTRTTNTNGISSFYVGCTDVAADRLIQYPITESDQTYTLTGLETGTEVVLFNSSDVELDREVLAGSTYTYNYTWNSDDGDTTGNYALIWKDDKVAQIVSGITLSNANQSIPISQQDDLIYGTPATNATVDFANSRIQMNDTSALSVPELYTYWKDRIRLSNNAQYSFAFSPTGGNTISGATSIPDYVFLQVGWTIRPYDDSYTLNVIDGIIVLSGGGDPFEDTANPQTVRINYQQPVQAITVSTGGGGGATASEVWSYSTRQLTGIGSSGIASEANATTNKGTIQSDIAAIPTAVETELDTRLTDIADNAEAAAYDMYK